MSSAVELVRVAEEGSDLCTCVMPYCDEAHAPLVWVSAEATYMDRPDDLDDWEGPPTPEYSESDFEAYDEMCREAGMGRW